MGMSIENYMSKDKSKVKTEFLYKGKLSPKGNHSISYIKESLPENQEYLPKMVPSVEGKSDLTGPKDENDDNMSSQSSMKNVSKNFDPQNGPNGLKTDQKPAENDLKSMLDPLNGPKDPKSDQKPSKLMPKSKIPELGKNELKDPKEDSRPLNPFQPGKISETKKFVFNHQSTVSISHSAAKRKKPDEDEEDDKKPKAENLTSPKMNVKQRKAKLEEKCRLARNAKEQSRGKKNQAKDAENMTMKDFMEELRGRFDSQDRKLDRNQGKMDLLNLKLEKIEDNAKKSEKANKEEISKLRDDLTAGLADMEDKVTEKVSNHLKPKIKDIQEQAKVDIGDAVQKEIRNVDIPGLIHNEVLEAMKDFKATDNSQVNSNSQEEVQNVNIPALIKEEVRLAMEGIKKPEVED